MLEDENTLYIFTDGSSLPRPRKGGVGIVFQYCNEKGKNQYYELDPPGYKGGTNNQMEIMACTLALIEARKNSRFQKCKNIVIRSDSQYVINNYRSVDYWHKYKWKRLEGAPVANVILWKQFRDAKNKLKKPLEIQKVKAHSDNALNNRAHKLANQSAKIPLNKPLQVVAVTRKISKQPTTQGSVKIIGQIMWIRIIGREYLHENKTYRYRYEVMNKDSEFFECVDFIYAMEHLHRNHIYKAIVNDKQNYPQIEEILETVKDRDWPQL